MEELSNKIAKGLYLTITPFFPTDKSFRGSFVYDQVNAILQSGRFDEVVVVRPSRQCKVITKSLYEGIPS